MRILRRERQRRRAAEPILARWLIQYDDLTGRTVEAPQHVIPALRVHVPFIQRIGDEKPVLESAGRIPVVRPYLAEVGAARDARRPRILLRPAYVVREVVVGGHAVELAVRQPVIRRPRLPAVDRNRRPLIDAREHPPRIRGIDPQESRIGAARRAPERRDVPPRVHRAVNGGAHQVHLIGILRIRVDLAARARQLAGAKRPALSSVVRAIQGAAARAAAAGARQRIQPATMRTRCDRKCGNACAVCEPAATDGLPGRAAVCGLVRAGIRRRRGLRRRRCARTEARSEQREDDLRITVVSVDVGCARRSIRRQDARPGQSAIARSINAAFAVDRVRCARSHAPTRRLP